MNKVNLEKAIGVVLFSSILVISSISTILQINEEQKNENEIFKAEAGCQSGSSPGCNCALPENDEDANIV